MYLRPYFLFGREPELSHFFVISRPHCNEESMVDIPHGHVRDFIARGRDARGHICRVLNSCNTG